MITMMEHAVTCFWWSCRPQWFSVRCCLVQKMDPLSALIPWAPPATSPPACSPAMKATFSLVPHLTLCNVERLETGTPHSHFVLVRPHFYVSTVQDFKVFKSVFMKVKLCDSLKRQLLTSSVPLSVFQLFSALLSWSWRMASPAVEMIQTSGSATETPAASAVLMATSWWDRAVWPAHLQLSGVRGCLTVKVKRGHT